MIRLVITKESGINLFSLVLDGGEPIRSDENRLLTIGDLFDFKTGTGANIIQKQRIKYDEVQVIDGGTFTFASTLELWVKLYEIGFFDGISTGGGGGGVNEFIDLTDTFSSYLGRDGQVLVVNESEQKIETQAISLFTPEDEAKLDEIEAGAQVNVQANWEEANPDSDAFILNKPELVIISIPKIQFIADGATDTFDIGVTAEIKGVAWEGQLLDDRDWEQTGTSFTLNFVPALNERIKPF